MKTPHQILLKRHSEVEPRLNATRQAALATITEKLESPRMSLREWLRSFRWHAVGLGAAWLVIMLLHVDSRQMPGTMAAIPSAKIPPARVIMTSLRENRRQLSEMIGSDTPAAKSLDLFPARPRSERRGDVFMA
jgi:hypothetical protein